MKRLIQFSEVFDLLFCPRAQIDERYEKMLRNPVMSPPSPAIKWKDLKQKRECRDGNFFVALLLILRSQAKKESLSGNQTKLERQRMFYF